MGLFAAWRCCLEVEPGGQQCLSEVHPLAKEIGAAMLERLWQPPLFMSTAPCARGARYAAFFWTQSLVREDSHCTVQVAEQPREVVFSYA